MRLCVERVNATKNCTPKVWPAVVDCGIARCECESWGKLKRELDWGFGSELFGEVGSGESVRF
jgi:hypothetical protein